MIFVQFIPIIGFLDLASIELLAAIGIPEHKQTLKSHLFWKSIELAKLSKLNCKLGTNNQKKWASFFVYANFFLK